MIHKDLCILDIQAHGISVYPIYNKKLGDSEAKIEQADMYSEILIKLGGFDWNVSPIKKDMSRLYIHFCSFKIIFMSFITTIKIKQLKFVLAYVVHLNTHVTKT